MPDLFVNTVVPKLFRFTAPLSVSGFFHGAQSQNISLPNSKADATSASPIRFRQRYGRHQRFTRTYLLFLRITWVRSTLELYFFSLSHVCPEDGSKTFLRNVCKNLAEYTWNLHESIKYDVAEERSSH
jgi:hypothetical protein